MKLDNGVKTKKRVNMANLLIQRFLMKRGYRIVATDYVNKVGKIDIIAHKDDKLHFIEARGVKRETTSNVKHETIDYYYNNRDITYRNMLFMKQTVDQFIKDSLVDSSKIQIDVIIVTFYQSREVPRIKVIENVI